MKIDVLNKGKKKFIERLSSFEIRKVPQMLAWSERNERLIISNELTKSYTPQAYFGNPEFYFYGR